MNIQTSAKHLKEYIHGTCVRSSYDPKHMMSADEHAKIVRLTKKRNLCKEPFEYLHLSELIASVVLWGFTRHTNIKLGDSIEVDNDIRRKSAKKPMRLVVKTIEVGMDKYSNYYYVIYGNRLKKNGVAGLLKVTAFPMNSTIRVLRDGVWVEI